MKKLLKIGSSILTLAFMTACGNGVISDSSKLDGTLSFAGVKQTLNGFAGKKGGMKGDKGAFSQNFLNLTEEQKTKLQELRTSLFPKNDTTTINDTKKANAEALKTAIKDAFLSDTIDVSSLKTKIESLIPSKVTDDARLTAHAEYILKSYQILTDEQKKTLETKQAEMQTKFNEMQSNRPTLKQPLFNNFNPADKMIERLSTKLTLTEEQKTKLKAVFEANKPAQVDTSVIDAARTKMQENRKAIQDSLKSGTATVDSIKALLQADKPEFAKDNLDAHLNILVQVHDILTSDQRKIAVDLQGIAGFGFGKGDHGMKGKGGHHKGGKGFEGFSKGIGFGMPF